ncbi:MAG: DUF1445 domain-containing protein [Verrucomicrobiae bacterium]|nr:DUF1445 domain-containing protein [Verrucomicrobiae bacterium]
MISRTKAEAPSLTLPQQTRLDIREGRVTGTAHGRAPGYLVCNLVVIRRALADEFLLYCQRNPQACPLLEVTDPGCSEPKRLAPGSDLRTDLSRYAIYRDGVREEDREDIVDVWENDFVAFLIGSGISFDGALERAGVPTTGNRWVVRTKLQTVPVGRFHGPMAVTMRWLTPAQAITAVQVTSRFPACHGAPIHIGDPELIGADLKQPLFGPVVPPIPKGLIAVFWPCGVTPQEAALAAKIDLMITHAPGHGFITDIEAERFVQKNFQRNRQLHGHPPSLAVDELYVATFAHPQLHVDGQG